jgi:hypothetical protein
MASNVDSTAPHDYPSSGRVAVTEPVQSLQVLGHAQMRTTTDTYSHVLPALGRDAADRSGNALWGPPAP